MISVKVWDVCYNEKNLTRRFEGTLVLLRTGEMYSRSSKLFEAIKEEMTIKKCNLATTSRKSRVFEAQALILLIRREVHERAGRKPYKLRS
jgi:hypothetical protein